MSQNYAGVLTLFERLTASEKRKRVTRNDAINSIVGEVQRIAETKSYFQREDEQDEGNILHYGLRNFLDFTVPDKHRLRDFCKALDKAIADYEPRIKQSKSSITQKKISPVTEVTIEAVLHDVDPGKKVVFTLPIAGQEAGENG